MRAPLRSILLAMVPRQRSATRCFAVALLARPAVLYGGLLGAGEPIGGDLSTHLGEIAQLERGLRGGDWDLWSPGGNLGYPIGY
jgi:hypothetical protein